MQLSGLILENFKSFAHRTIVPMAPITLLFGENSAGKSSILQSLLLLKQTLPHTEPGVPLLLPRGELVDLGSVREMIYGHDTARTCEISLLVDGLEGSSSAVFCILADRLAFGIGIRFGCEAETEPQALQIAGLPVYWSHAESPLFVIAKDEPTRPLPDGDNYALGHEMWPRSGAETSTYSAQFLDHAHGVLRIIYHYFVCPSPQLRHR